MRARVGHPAPDFEATVFTNGKFENLRLSDYKGSWTVLCFYPGDFTFVCATEVSAMALAYPKLQEMGVKVISASTDSHFTHKIWNDEELSKMVGHDIPFPMIADAGGRIGEVYGVYEEAAGVDVRGRFVIDPDGVIQAMEVMTPTVGRNVKELMRQLQGFIYVREHPEQVVPAAWEPGKTTLKPGPELAGKVWEVWDPKQELDLG